MDVSDNDLKFKMIKSPKHLLNIIVINFYPIFLMNYELFFFISLLIGLGSLNCRYMWVKGGLDTETSSSNYIQTSGFNNALFSTSSSEEITEVWVRENVSYLNDSTSCRSLNWYIEASFGVIIIFSNIILRVVSGRLMKFIPSFKVFACKYGNSDLLYDIFLSIVIFGRIFFVNINEINSEETYETIRWITLGSFSLILLGYFIIFFSRPYYNSFQQKLKSFQILYLLCLMAFSIIIRETEFGLVKTQNSAMILLCLTLTVLLKSNNNLLRTDISRLIKKS